MTATHEVWSEPFCATESPVERDPSRPGWQVAPGYADDLTALADAFFTALKAAGLGDVPVVVSVEDLLVGDCLIDVKVSSSSRFHREWLTPIVRRLIDPNARHGACSRAERVGLYSARHPAALVWDAAEFLATLSRGRDRLELEGAYEALAGETTPDGWARELGWVPTRRYWPAGVFYDTYGADTFIADEEAAQLQFRH